MNYKDIQKTAFYNDIYSKVEELKKDYPVNHGFLHVNHVLSNAKKLSKTFKLNNNQKRLLYIACALHDIGYLKGRENHAESGKEMASEFLADKGFSQKDIFIICDAIARHGGKELDDYKSPISLCLVLADKLDFVGSRYNPNIVGYPVNPIYLAIQKLDLEVGEDEIVLNFIVKQGFDADEFIKGHFGRKLLLVFDNLSLALNKPYRFEYKFV